MQGALALVACSRITKVQMQASLGTRAALLVLCCKVGRSVLSFFHSLLSPVCPILSGQQIPACRLQDEDLHPTFTGEGILEGRPVSLFWDMVEKLC